MRNIYLLLSCIIGSTIIAQDLSDHLLLQYSFDGNTNDVSGNNHHGIPFGVSYGPDRYGNPNSACYFNGIDNYVNFPNLAALKPNLPVSFSFWINYLSQDYNQQVVFNTSFEDNHCTGVWFNSALATNAHAINFGNGNYFYSPQSRNTLLCYKQVDLYQWMHIVVVVNSESDMKMYIGCLDNPGTYTGTGGGILAYSDTPGCIGRHDRDLDAPAGYFKGYIDDFRYWDKALTTADVEALCQYLSVSEVDSDKNYLKLAYDYSQQILELHTDVRSVAQVIIYNALGQQIYVDAFKPQIDVAAFARGIYFVTLKNDQGTITKKVIIH